MSKTKVKIQPMIEVGNLEPKPIEKAHIEIANQKQDKVSPTLLVSRLNYPITIKYDKSIIRISPRGKIKVANKDLLGDLPVGVDLKKL